MPPGVVETLASHGLLSADEVSHAFANGERLASWAAKKVPGFDAAAVETLLAADRQLRRETGFDSPQPPEEKCIGKNLPSSTPPPPPNLEKGGGGKKRGRQPFAKGAKTTAKRPPSQPAASSASAAAPQNAHGGALHSHDRAADEHAAALEAVLDVYLNLGAAGQKWLPGGIEHNETRRELVLRPLRRLEPRSVRARLATLRRWQTFASAAGGEWEWTCPPTLELGAFLLAVSERGPTAAAGTFNHLLWWEASIGVPLGLLHDALRDFR